MLGVIIGKFYPPHVGHGFLIETGLAQCEELVVIVCDHPNQAISGGIRANWLQQQFPTARVVVTPDDLPDAPVPWAERTIEMLGRPPDMVFTSEEYGPGYANAMRCRHVLVDQPRSTFPVSATMIREDPLSRLHLLLPTVRRDFVVRVVLIGVESTGKSTMAEALANRLETRWVPEFGREYSGAKTDSWNTADFVVIAQRQQEMENSAAEDAKRVLICDTNAVATSVWHRRYMGVYSEQVDAIAQQDRVDLYLLTTPDFPFVQDGTRDGEHIRHEMHTWFEERLNNQTAQVVRLKGDHESRLQTALDAIELASQQKADSLFTKPKRSLLSRS
jgi:NadR type nicotinamide-nucleotide adenylyltransferase